MLLASAGFPGSCGCKTAAQNIAGDCRHAHVACCSDCRVAPGKNLNDYMRPYRIQLWSDSSVEAQQALVRESARLILELAEVSPAAECWVPAPATKRLWLPLLPMASALPLLLMRHSCHLMVYDNLLLSLPAALLLPVIDVARCCDCWQATDAIAPACCLTLCPHSEWQMLAALLKGLQNQQLQGNAGPLTSCVFSNLR